MLMIIIGWVLVRMICIKWTLKDEPIYKNYTYIHTWVSEPPCLDISSQKVRLMKQSYFSWLFASSITN